MTTMAITPLAAPELEPVQRLSRDLKHAARTLLLEEARYLVDAYYSIQQFRLAAGNQRFALINSGEPHSVLDWYFVQLRTVEDQIKKALDEWTDGVPLGRWAKSIIGIGPVIAAGLLAHIDIEKAPSVGKIWRYAGLDPTVQWEKGQRRPWNDELKTLCWKIGQSFVKMSGRPNDIYGKVYLQRKAVEIARNEAGAFADQAARILREKNIGKDTEAYKHYRQGKLPPAHLQRRAERYAVKLFLSHYHHVAFELHYGKPPAKPYVIEHLGHVDFIAPPNWPMVDRAA